MARSARCNDTQGLAGDRYHLYAVNKLGNEFYLGDGESRAPSFSNLHAWPNPFGAGALTVRFAAASAPGGGNGHASVAVYDVAGRLVRVLADGVFTPQLHTVEWDGASQSGERVSSGVYFVQSTSGGVTDTRKISVIR